MQSPPSLGRFGYRLVSVLEHVGDTASSGHYLAYVRKGDDGWWMCNDRKTTQVSADRVLNSKATMLFYRLEEDDEDGEDIWDEASLERTFGPARTPVGIDIAEDAKTLAVAVDKTGVRRQLAFELRRIGGMDVRSAVRQIYGAVMYGGRPPAPVAGYKDIVAGYKDIVRRLKISV